MYNDYVLGFSTKEFPLNSWSGKRFLSFPDFPQRHCVLLVDTNSYFSRGKSDHTPQSSYKVEN